MQRNRGNNTKEKLLKKKHIHIGYYIPLIIIIAVIPLISFAIRVELPVEEANFWKGGTNHFDVFSYYKSMWFIIVTLSSLVAYASLTLNKQIPLKKEPKYYIPLTIYAMFTIISTIMSPNKGVAMQGFIEMYQGMPVLLCYALVTFMMINYINEERDVKIITYAYIAIIVTTGVLGVFQYFGYDFFKSAIGQWLILPNEYKGATLKFNFDKYTIYTTMYNTNFVGSFGAMVLPLSTSMYLFAQNTKQKIAYGLITVLAYATWLGCNSRAGYVGVGVAFVFGIIIFRKVIKEKYKQVLSILACFIIITLVFNTVSGGRVFGQFSKLNPINEAEKIQQIKENNPVRFEEVSIKDNIFTIKTTKETLICSMEESIINFRDETGTNLDIKSNQTDGTIKFQDEKYKDYSFVFNEEKSTLDVSVYSRWLELYILPDETFKVISLNSKLTNPIEAPRIKIFDGRETFASNRGYIWSRSIPMLRDTWLTGYGPDNYCMMFPQEDYVGRFNTGSAMLDIVIDKPHNMYLQTGINTGGISLLALLFMWFVYFVDSVKIYLRANMTTYTEYIGAGVFLGVMGYLASGMFNDHIISVAPMFWAMLGLGIAINRIDKTKTQ